MSVKRWVSELRALQKKNLPKKKKEIVWSFLLGAIVVDVQ